MRCSQVQYPSFKCIVTQIKQYFCLGKDTKVRCSGLQQESWGSLSSFFLLTVVQGCQAWHCFRGCLIKQAAQVLGSHPLVIHHQLLYSSWKDLAWLFFLNGCPSNKEKNMLRLLHDFLLWNISYDYQQANCSWKKNSWCFNHCAPSCPEPKLWNNSHVFLQRNTLLLGRFHERRWRIGGTQHLLQGWLRMCGFRMWHVGSARRWSARSWVLVRPLFLSAVPLVNAAHTG